MSTVKMKIASKVRRTWISSGKSQSCRWCIQWLSMSGAHLPCYKYDLHRSFDSLYLVTPSSSMEVKAILSGERPPSSTVQIQRLRKIARMTHPRWLLSHCASGSPQWGGSERCSHGHERGWKIKVQPHTRLYQYIPRITAQRDFRSRTLYPSTTIFNAT
jgi:hypothetical protein